MLLLQCLHPSQLIRDQIETKYFIVFLDGLTSQVQFKQLAFDKLASVQNLQYILKYFAH